MSQENALVEYIARDSTKIKLSNAIIKKYFVSGRAEFVTDQEMVLYAGICKSRGLNPFTRDVFIVKYTPNESAAIITSIDYYRKRARAQADCKGWRVGIVIVKNGELVYRPGCILLENEILVGGWAEATPDGWKEPMRKEVNLKRYIKKTKDGSVTRFWSEDNQPEMIAKVAESQLLRALWPDEFGGMYVDSEVQSRDAQEELSTAISTASPEPSGPTFEQVFAAEIADPTFADFLNQTALTYDIGIEEAKAECMNQVEAVKAAFRQWREKRQSEAAAQAETKAPANGTNGGNGETKAAPAETAAPAVEMSKEEVFRAEWINLKEKGFGPYVGRNISRFKEASDELRKEALAKWVKFYREYPCPFSEHATAEPAQEPATPAQPKDDTRRPQEAPNGQPSSPQDVQRTKIIDEIKRYPDAVVMEAKRRAGVSIMPSQWPPSLEGCARLLDQVNAVAEEKGKGAR